MMRKRRTALFVILFLPFVVLVLRMCDGASRRVISAAHPGIADKIRSSPVEAPRCDMTRSETNRSEREESRRLRFELERDGALAELDIRVVDQAGRSLEGCFVRLYFNQPESRPKHAGVIDGRTDENGCFSARCTTTFACSWKIRKPGFHDASGIVPFSNHFSLEQGRHSRWMETPCSLVVTLTEKSGAAFVRGAASGKLVRFPTNEWVGFDFEALDCTPPLGTGKTAHVLLFSEGSAGNKARTLLAGGVWTNRLRIACPGGGLSVLSRRENTDMPFCPVAPESFPTNELEFVQIQTERSYLTNRVLDDGKFIVFQTATNPAVPGEPPHFGIIDQMRFDPGEMSIDYFFNTEPGDRRTDADTSAVWDLRR